MGAADLPQPGQARTNAQPRFTPGRAELVFGMRTGARPDDRHLSHQHIEKLWEFVEVIASQEPANARETRGHFAM